MNDTSIDLFFETLGQGRPMLLMHGGLGFDHSTLRPWLDPLAEVATLVYYDHRGCGASPEPDDWEAVDHASWVADADALRAHLGLERMVLFGHSYGGYLALEYALAHPERLDGLVISNAAPALDYQDVMLANAQKRATEAQLQALMKGLSGPAESDEAYGDLFRAVAPIYFHDPAHPAIEKLAGRIRYRAGSFNRGMFHCLPGYDVSARLGEIQVPTLVLGGGDDWITPREHGADRLAAGIPGAREVILEGTGHFPFVEAREAYVAAIREFLSGLG